MSQQQMMEQQMMEQQMMEQQMREQQMMEQSKLNVSNIDGNIPDLSQVTQMSLQDKILLHGKQPLLVGAIVAILSLPIINTLITKIVSTKEALQKFLIPLTLIIKAILGGGLFFGISNSTL